MVGSQDVIMTENLESKLDAIMHALVTLSHRTAEIEGVMAVLHDDGAPEIAQSRIYQSQTTVQEEAILPVV